ncbi:MAG: sugar ABC transporter substrate-binding protein [Clostridium sp.]
MKRILAMGLIAMSSIGLIGCGGSKGAEEDVASLAKDASIKVQVEEGWLPYYEKAKERVLKKYEGAQIEFITNGSFDHLGIIDNTDITNEDVADVFALPLDRFDGLTKNNALAKIDAKEMSEQVGGFKDFDKGIGGSLKVGNDYFAFPYNIETLIGYVNVKNAKDKKVDITKDIEFSDLDYQTLSVLVHDAWFGVAFANSAGFELLSNEGGEFKTDATKAWSELDEKQKGLFESVYKYWKEHDKNKTDLWDKKAAGGYLDEQFNTGKNSVIRIDGPWATPNLAERVGSEENLEVVPLNRIKVNGQALQQWKGGWALGVNARVEEDPGKLELSKEMIKELVNPEFAKDLFKQTGKILENVEPSAYEGIDALNKKVIDATYESYEAAVLRPLFAEYGKVWDSWQNALLSWSSTQPKNAEEAYKQVQASFETMMGTIKK